MGAKCGLCDPNGNLREDGQTIAEEVFETIKSENSFECGVDSYSSCATWKDHCEYDYIRIQCSKTCNYCPENVDQEGSGEVIESGIDKWFAEEAENAPDAPDENCKDVDPNCKSYKAESHCNLEVIQTLCPTTCEVGPCGIAPGDSDVIEIGSGEGSGDFGSGDFAVEQETIPDNIPMSCRPGGEFFDVGRSQGQIDFVAPQDLPYQYKRCEYHVRNADEDDIVLLDFYKVFDIRTEQDCNFYIEVYSDHVPIVRLCGNGEHPPIAGRNLKIVVEAYAGFGFTEEVSAIGEDAFKIIQSASDRKYFTMGNTHDERVNCRDEQFCFPLKEMCTDDLVSDRCPVTCGKCHPLETPIAQVQKDCDDVHEYCFSLRNQCDTQTVAKICKKTCELCDESEFNGIAQHLQTTDKCFDQAGCDELDVSRCTDYHTGFNVRTKCPIRCGVCARSPDLVTTEECVDNIKTCPLLTEGCSELHVAAHCAKTCERCPTKTSECADSYSYCQMWRVNCHHHFVSLACPATCGICDAPGQIPRR